MTAPFDPATLQQITAGMAAGITGTVCGHPLDLIKVRLQARSDYTGCLDCISKTFKSDGIRGMFRGLASPLFGLTPMSAFTFTCYNTMNDYQEAFVKKFDKDDKLTAWNYCISGSGVGLLASIIGTPLEVTKVRLQLDEKKVIASSVKNSPVLLTSAIASSEPLPTSVTSLSANGRKYSGFFDCGRKIFRHEGIRGFYTGYVPTVTRDVLFCGVYFGLYETMKQRLKASPLLEKDSGGFSPLPIVLSGGVSGMLAWLVSIPLDAIKTSMQDVDKRHAGGKKPGMLSAAKSLYQRVGIKGFYTGLAPTLVRAFLVSSVRFITYESVLHLFREHNQRRVSV